MLLPEGRRADIVVVDPPGPSHVPSPGLSDFNLFGTLIFAGTPLHGRSPFAILPALRKELLQARAFRSPHQVWSSDSVALRRVAALCVGQGPGGTAACVLRSRAPRESEAQKLARGGSWAPPPFPALPF